MSEVKFKACDLRANAIVVQEYDFDRVTADLKAAMAELKATKIRENLLLNSPNNVFKQMCDLAVGQRNSLQQRLTAADERNDNRDSEIFAQVQSALRRSFSLGQIYWQQADSDSTCQQNKSDQTMEVQEQHILNVLKSVGTALNPAEGAHDPAPLNPHWPADTAEELADYRAWRKAQIKPADGADYRKSCEVAHKALSMENQRVLVPGQFKCLACGDIHPGSGNLPCPKMSPTC